VTSVAFKNWNDIRGEHIERVGIERVTELKSRLSLRLQMQPLIEIRHRKSLTQSDVAQSMGVTVGRVSQIESGEVAGFDVLDRYARAIGGRLTLSVDFDKEVTSDAAMSQ